jgi:hypothetical protein
MIFPGAGSYVIPSKIVEGPKYFMGSRLARNESSSLKNPGPGAYDL